MKRKHLIALATMIAGISFAQVPMPAQTVPSAPVQAAQPPTTMSPPPAQSPTPQPTTTTPSPNPVQTPTTQAQQPPTPAIPPPAQPLTPQEMQQLNQLVPPMVGPTPAMPPMSGLPSLPGVMSKRDRVKNYEVLQRVGNIYVVSSPGKHTYVIRSDSQILRRYKCHIEYPYTYCAKKHKKAHKPKHGSY